NEVIPPGATVHTFTGHVNVSCQPVSASCVGGYANAPDGTVINFAFVGAHVGTLSASSCVTAGGTGAGSVTGSSATPGVDTVQASTAVVVDELTLTRATGDGKAGDGPNAIKTWVDANIQITPDTATNPVSTQHVLTGHVNVNTGTGGYVNAPDA